MARPEARLKELKPSELRHEVEARRELVVTLNRRSQPRLIAYGDDFLVEKLPAGTLRHSRLCLIRILQFATRCCIRSMPTRCLHN